MRFFSTQPSSPPASISHQSSLHTPLPIALISDGNDLRTLVRTSLQLSLRLGHQNGANARQQAIVDPPPLPSLSSHPPPVPNSPVMRSGMSRCLKTQSNSNLETARDERFLEAFQ